MFKPGRIRTIERQVELYAKLTWNLEAASGQLTKRKIDIDLAMLDLSKRSLRRYCVEE
jgi:hypothetical protein